MLQRLDERAEVAGHCNIVTQTKVEVLEDVASPLCRLFAVCQGIAAGEAHTRLDS
ncbi:MAG TPA: hypothetical protein VMK12_06085 [Anaeromyxobacteraceae bacterium]|nr:hypothetical protein [Anaeromyxobacteraceae bacterium]